MQIRVCSFGWCECQHGKNPATFWASFSRTSTSPKARTAHRRILKELGSASCHGCPPPPWRETSDAPNSMFRATISFFCRVDSRIISPFHMNLYQYTPHEPRFLPHLLQVPFGPFLSQPPRL